MADCPFCERLEGGEGVEFSDLSATFPDAYPLTPGHMLVVPRRHVARLSDLTVDEHEALWGMADAVRRRTPGADGFNIGVNDGSAAGQTIEHVHFHVIPRRAGDMADPRGGIRWAVPATAKYWPDA